LGLDPKSNVAGARRAMRSKDSSEPSYVSAEKQQEGRPGANRKSRSAASLKISIGNLAQSESFFIERNGSVQIRDVKRRFENRVKR
jgi:hypothetical protein